MKREPLVAQPIAQPTNDGALAPWPVIDRYPLVIGPGLSLTYVSTVFRLSLSGYRMEYVDLLDELLEKDPHAFSRLQSRFLAVADGRVALTAANCADGEKAEAQKIAEFCQRAVDGIPCLHQHIATLAWANFYAIKGLEIHWRRTDDGFLPKRLSMVHSRRLSYPVYGSWDLYIWDQGQVLPGQFFGQAPTSGPTFGLRVADYPGKFIIHAPQIRGNYPTREGLGRQIAYWLVLKLIAARGAPQYLERFAKPWPEAEWKTSSDTTANPRAADDVDIEKAKDALRSMGAGTLAAWVHPDSIKLNLRTPDSGSSAKVTFQEWIQICDGQVSEAISGGTLTSQVTQSGGNRALGEVHERGELRLARYDGRSIADTLKRDLITWIVKLNFPGKEHLTPKTAIHVEPDPTPAEMINRAKEAVGMGMPVDADELADMTGLPIVAEGDMKARRLVPVAPMKTRGPLSVLDTPIGPAEAPEHVGLETETQRPSDAAEEPAATEEEDDPAHERERPAAPAT